MIKTILDFLIACIALFILLPVFLIVAFKVLKNLGSPIFFLQERRGKDGKLFKMIKFRSMKDVVDKEGNPLPDEQRITPFGQKLRSTSLDEMPQLINVLKGDIDILVQSLQELIVNKNLRLQLGDNSRHLYETQFNFNTMLHKTLDVYTQVLSKRSLK